MSNSGACWRTSRKEVAGNDNRRIEGDGTPRLLVSRRRAGSAWRLSGLFYAQRPAQCYQASGLNHKEAVANAISGFHPDKENRVI